MQSKSMRCTKICNACSQHWSTERAQFFSTTMPHYKSHNQCFESWTHRGTKFCFIHHFTWSLASQLPLLQASQQLFTGKMLLQPAESRKCFSRVQQIPKHRFLQYRSKPTYLIGKNVIIVMVSILINKDVIEPSYNDLKFMVQNGNYFSISLITQ